MGAASLVEAFTRKGEITVFTSSVCVVSYPDPSGG